MGQFFSKKWVKFQSKFSDPKVNPLKLLESLDALMVDSYLTLANDFYYWITDFKRFINKDTDGTNKLQQIALEKNEDLKKLQIQWEKGNKPAINFSQYLLSSLDTRFPIYSSLLKLCPPTKEYSDLYGAMKRYVKLKDGQKFKEIAYGQVIKLNTQDTRIPAIKERLFSLGDLAILENPTNNIYNETSLIDAVKQFQMRHNLVVTGEIGKATLTNLNISLESKINKIAVNLDRLRWEIPKDLSTRNNIVKVNIPSFKMRLFEKDKEVMDMKVIVGKVERPTPIFNALMNHTVINPTWTAPSTIVEEDIIGGKNLKKYLASHKMGVFINNGKEKINVDPDDIDWSNVDTDAHPFSFTAEPGRSNPLGEVKFIFPNNHSVFMHDTNQRGLFASNTRAYSSGCIRLGEPKKLLEYILGVEQKPMPKVSKNENKEKVVVLKEKIPVFIEYKTVKVQNDGKVYFYKDIYGYDKIQLAIIKDKKNQSIAKNISPKSTNKEAI